MEEEQCTQLNQKYKQLHGENWTHVEQLKSTKERVKVLENSKNVRNTKEPDICHTRTEKHEW